MGLRIDLGCGKQKKAGCIGVDNYAGPGIDHVLDLQKDQLPFPDDSVEYIFTSHCLEHLTEHFTLFHEIVRVAIDGAILDIWLPYSFGVDGSILGHVQLWNEGQFEHFCTRFPYVWRESMGVSMLWRELNYIVDEQTLSALRQQKVDIAFAIRFFKCVVAEFNVVIELRKDLTAPPTMPVVTYATSRVANRVRIN